jgi:hypothetical protein
MKCGRLLLLTSGIVAVSLAIGCQPTQTTNKADSPGGKYAIETESAANDPKQLALAAKEALFKQLSSRLLEAMGSGGPVAAIEVCSQEAPRIAVRVGEDHGVKIGRTSFKLRNSKNAPPEWVTPLIESRPTEPQFAELPDKHTGALFPIMLKVQCLACHGPKDQIADNVQAELTRLYPDDQAVDFNEGDLRGWFWVDVPDHASTSQSKAKNEISSE